MASEKHLWRPDRVAAWVLVKKPRRLQMLWKRKMGVILRMPQDRTADTIELFTDHKVLMSMAVHMVNEVHFMQRSVYDGYVYLCTRKLRNGVNADATQQWVLPWGHAAVGPASCWPGSCAQHRRRWEIRA